MEMGTINALSNKPNLVEFYNKTKCVIDEILVHQNRLAAAAGLEIKITSKKKKNIYTYII